MQEISTARGQKLQDNFKEVTRRIEAACARSGRDPRAVNLLAVTKYADPSETAYLLAQGLIKQAGESRVQDAGERWISGEPGKFRDKATLHFIGHLQTNKANKAVELFDSIDCVDSAKLAAELDRQAAKRGKVMPVLIQLKLTGSETQSGLEPAKAGELLAAARVMKNLRPYGYMAIAPVAQNPETLRPVFREVKKLFDKDFAGVEGAALSLGMSGDFEVAVEEGSNLPRIGSLLFV